MNTESTNDPRINTIIIDINKQCPSVEDISGPVRHEGRDFSATALAIVGAAINEGLFYVDDVKAYCSPRWQAEYPLTDVCLTASGDTTYVMAPERHEDRRAQMDNINAKLAAAPRGTWALVRQDWKSGDGHAGTSWSLRISVGNGEVHGAQPNPIWQNEKRIAGFNDAVKCLIGTEIYRATNAERARRESARSRQLIKDTGWRHGATLRNVKIAGKTFSTALIVMITEEGFLRLELTKRGSRNRWNWTGVAQSIEVDGVTNTIPAYGQLFAHAAA